QKGPLSGCVGSFQIHPKDITHFIKFRKGIRTQLEKPSSYAFVLSNSRAGRSGCLNGTPCVPGATVSNNTI
ncbi:MAG: hypothetical protein UD575_14220, partial [Oscillospiraceae bacterium]|nr:hypothetical protein [Oscillospiraceae bacterium]